MNILIKFPTRSRKDKFFQTLDIYYDKLSNIENTFFHITCDSDDVSMNNGEVIDKLKSYKNLTFKFGISQNKIDAVNRDMEEMKNYDIILLASDDMIPQVKGYDEIIRNKMNEFYPDTDGVLWFNDGHQKERLNTLCILGKKYYDRFKYIYYPQYKSTWSDNEFTQVANKLKKQTYFNEIIIRHEHPHCGYGKMDEIYRLNNINERHDKSLFFNRVNKNFDL